MVASHLFGAGKQAARRGVFLAIARPQPLSEKKKHRIWYQKRVVGLSAFWEEGGAVLPSVPTMPTRTSQGENHSGNTSSW